MGELCIKYLSLCIEKIWTCTWHIFGNHGMPSNCPYSHWVLKMRYRWQMSPHKMPIWLLWHLTISIRLHTININIFFKFYIHVFHNIYDIQTKYTAVEAKCLRKNITEVTIQLLRNNALLAWLKKLHAAFNKFSSNLFICLWSFIAHITAVVVVFRIPSANFNCA